MAKKPIKKTNTTRYLILTISALAILAVAFSFKSFGKPSGSGSDSGKLRAAEVTDSDIVIPVKEITETAKFFPAKIDGTELEVLAVKAPDGTIRTAFNTCQVCYSSGKGYYKQEGDELVCQNCGNHFSMDQVEVVKGGCNPVPISDEYKTTDDTSITISKDYLTKATAIFQNWK